MRFRILVGLWVINYCVSPWEFHKFGDSGIATVSFFFPLSFLLSAFLFGEWRLIGDGPVWFVYLSIYFGFRARRWRIIINNDSSHRYHQPALLCRLFSFLSFWWQDGTDIISSLSSSYIYRQIHCNRIIILQLRAVS